MDTIPVAATPLDVIIDPRGAAPRHASASEESLEHRAPAELFALGRQLFENDSFEHSAALFGYLLVRRCREPVVWLWLGRCHEALGQLDVAVSIYGAGRICVDADQAGPHAGAGRDALSAALERVRGFRERERRRASTDGRGV